MTRNGRAVVHGRMMRERERMNSESPSASYRIGIASGQMVAGCIGADTAAIRVVGERVNWRRACAVVSAARRRS